MLITERFNWLHIPKTAGSKTRQVLLNNAINRTNELLYNASANHGGAAMHTSIIPEEYRQHKRPTAMNFRILKDLVLSHNSFFLRNIFSKTDFKPDLWEKNKEHTLKGEIYDWLGQSTTKYIRVDEAYKPFLKMQSHVTFLRAEFLTQDICDWLESLNIIIDKDSLLTDTKRINGSDFPQPNILDEDFSVMYNNNPRWAELERKLYGS